MGKSNIEKWIETGSEIAGAGFGGILGLAVADPAAGAVVASAGSVVVTKTLEKIGIEMSSRFLGKREEVRVGAVFTYYIAKIKENMDNGYILRDDSFFDEKLSERSDAEEVYEGLILVAQKEHEEKKIKYIGNMLANIVFRKDIDRACANLLIKEASNLSYRQICILKVFYENTVALKINENGIGLKKSNYREEGISTDLIPTLYEILELDHKEFIINNMRHVNCLLDIVPSEYRSQSIGILLYELFELKNMEEEEIEEIKKLLS